MHRPARPSRRDHATGARRRASLASLAAAALVATGLVAPAASATTPAAPTPVPGPEVVVDHESFPYESPRSDVRSPLRALADTSVHALHVVLLDPGWADGSGKPSGGWITDAQATALTDEVHDYWVDQSDGAVSTTVASLTRFRYPGARCATVDDILDIWNRAGASRYGTNWIESETAGPAQREHFVVLAPYRGSDLGETTCAGTLGLGSVPPTASTSHGGIVFGLYGGRTAAQLSDGAHTLAHELGHNLGLQHAGTVWCDGNRPDPNLTRFPSDCYNYAYVDSYDVMGTALAPNVGVPALSSPGRTRLGVHKDHLTSPGYGTRTVRLSPLGSATGTQAISVVDPVSRSRYYVEFRQSSAPWPGHAVDLTSQGLPLRFGDGVRVVRLAPADSADAFKNEQVLLPQGTPSGRTSFLPAGRSFTTATGALTLTASAVGTGAAPVADVRVVVRSAPPVTLTASKSTQTYRSSSVATLRATLGAVDGTVPAGTITFKEGTTRLGAVKVPTSGTSAGKVSLALPRTLGAGKHSFKAVFTPADPDVALRTVSGATSVTVSPARSTVALSVSPTRVSTGTSAKATVKVSVAGVTNPTGNTSVYVGSTRIKTVKLTAAHRGTFTVSLPRYATTGTRSVKAVYAGSSANVARATSAVVRLTVV